MQVDNLVQLAESDLGDLIEGDWSLPVVLISPEGVVYDTSANDPLLPLVGQVIRETIVENPDTGGQIVVHKPVVSIRRSSLERVPEPLERWCVQIPNSPLSGAPMESYTISRPTEDGSTLGFIQLYLQALEQEV